MKRSKAKANKLHEKDCPVSFCMRVIGGKWKPILLFRISTKINRFGNLLKSIEGINKQMLSKQLKELEKDGVLERKVFAEIPPRVEYSLTTKGKSLMPVVKSMDNWGKKNLKLIKETKSNGDEIDRDQLPLFEF